MSVVLAVCVGLNAVILAPPLTPAGDPIMGPGVERPADSIGGPTDVQFVDISAAVDRAIDRDLPREVERAVDVAVKEAFDRRMNDVRVQLTAQAVMLSVFASVVAVIVLMSVFAWIASPDRG